MKQLKQSPVAKIIAWILITVSALMLLAGTAGAYAISELGFYTRSVEDIREKQFERIAGKYSARVLLNLNNTENETYFKVPTSGMELWKHPITRNWKNWI